MNRRTFLLTADRKPPPREWLDSMTDPFRAALLRSGTGVRGAAKLALS